MTFQLTINTKNYQFNKLRNNILTIHIIGLMVIQENIVPLLHNIFINKVIISG